MFYGGQGRVAFSFMFISSVSLSLSLLDRSNVFYGCFMVRQDHKDFSTRASVRKVILESNKPLPHSLLQTCEVSLNVSRRVLKEEL
jgi:hypothetical protein